MKKYIIYIGILVVGLILGYLIFGGRAETTKAAKNISDTSENSTDQNQMWTCSMHPQIMQPEPGDCPICGMDLIPAETSADNIGANEIKMSENAMALANIQTTIVGNISATDQNEMQLSGKIVANEEANAVQASYFEGRIEKLNVSFTGEELRKGQLLATIYAPTLVAAQQELITASSMKASQPQLYQAVRNKLKLWKLSESQIDQIEASGQVRENFPIYATVSGTVSQKMAEEGDYVKQGQPIVKVNDLGSVWASFDVYENQISQLKEGQKITVVTNAYPNKEFEATVTFIDPTLNTKSRTLSVRTTLNNKEDLLKPGMFVTGKIAIEAGTSTSTQITIPSTAVLWTGNRSLVYVKTNPNEPIFEMREVTLGNKNSDVYTITKGLSNGDEVVTNGTFTVDAAAQLQGKRSMMNAKKESSTKDSSLINTISIKRYEVSKPFKEQLNAVLTAYFSLKEALVNDNSEKAKSSAESLKERLAKVDMSLLKGEAHAHWMTLQKELNTSTISISTSSDIEKQRKEFIYLSAHLINAVKAYGVDGKVYVDFCPMANNNVGAHWLSQEKEILNPYFGSDMLTCGSVTEEIK
ncbi:membrane fusion protein, Cu(I)/Ag(I) efflux system [Flavobacteriaceae bacterium MAR_2010_188]|nr:membrane fusion protein, Cu(I)/Ag(I) efflux system [Flavobacteriaceae bacterium MAR_2010_188]